MKKQPKKMMMEHFEFQNRMYVLHLELNHFRTALAGLVPYTDTSFNRLNTGLFSLPGRIHDRKHAVFPGCLASIGYTTGCAVMRSCQSRAFSGAAFIPIVVKKL